MWWATYKNTSETDILFPRQSLGGLWTLGHFVALCALLGILGTSAVPHLVLPAALLGLYVFLSYLTGVVGMAVFLPLQAYGWLCLNWFLAHGTDVIDYLTLLEGLLVSTLIVAFLISAPHVRANLLVPVVIEGIFYSLSLIFTYVLLVPELDFTYNGMDTAQILQRLADIGLIGVNATSLIVLAIIAYVAFRHAGELWEMRAQALPAIRLVGLGLVPPVLGSLLARLNPTLGVVCAVALYVALAFLAAGSHDAKAAWALLPLVLLGTSALLTTVPMDHLPTFGPGIAAVSAIHDGPLGALAREATMPLLEAVDGLVGAPLSAAICQCEQWLTSPRFWLKVILAPLYLYLLVRQPNQAGGLEQSFTTDTMAELPTVSPSGTPLALVLGLYALVFIASALIGTVVGFADLRAWVARRRERGTVPEESTTVEGSDNASDELVPPEDGEASTSVLPAWFTFDLARDAAAPFLKKVQERRRRHWDEQLSGQTILWDEAESSQVDKLRREHRLSSKPGPGLWWKVFEDDGRMSLIPKGDLFGTFLMLLFLYLLFYFCTPLDYGHLVAPVALILFSLGAGYVAGLVGIIATGPVFVYGWSAAIWCMFMTGGSYQSNANYVDAVLIIRVLALLVAFSFFTKSMRNGTGLTIALAYYASGLAWLLSVLYASNSTDEATVRTFMGYAYTASVVCAVVFTVRAFYKETRLLMKWPEGRADEVKSVILCAAGFIPLLVAGQLAPLGDLISLAGAVACYVALAVAGRLYSPKGLSWPLFFLMLGTTAYIVSSADVSTLPPSTATDLLLSSCLESAPVKLLEAGAMPLIHAFDQIFSGIVGPFALLLLRLDSVSDVPVGIMSLLCLCLGIIAVSSLMGVTVSVVEPMLPKPPAPDSQKTGAEEQDVKEQVYEEQAAEEGCKAGVEH